MTDPESTTDLPPADLAEVEVDEADEFSRPLPDEADPADVAEQRTDVPTDDEEQPDL
ncbi:MAG TPA: hypothetical protein VFH38_08605 [Jatrophihabitans sp.]|nr:hypothetical protein [Jatrophihabitans sp.]